MPGILISSSSPLSPCPCRTRTRKGETSPKSKSPKTFYLSFLMRKVARCRHEEEMKFEIRDNAQRVVSCRLVGRVRVVNVLAACYDTSSHSYSIVRSDKRPSTRLISYYCQTNHHVDPKQCVTRFQLHKSSAI